MTIQINNLTGLANIVILRAIADIEECEKLTKEDTVFPGFIEHENAEIVRSYHCFDDERRPPALAQPARKDKIMNKPLIRWVLCADGFPQTWAIRGTQRECRLAAENTYKVSWRRLRDIGFSIERVRITLETEIKR